MDLPTVRVNALALRNLSSLPYLQLRASGGTAPPALAARARWLEHGLGAAQALTAAATAALAESVPSVLVAPVRRTSNSRKDVTPPAIWIFGTHGDIGQACELLGAAFSEAQQGVWTHRSPKAQTDALFDAISRAIISALEADGALRLGPDIVHPTFELSYRFKLALSGGLNPTVVLRIAVHNIDLRYVDDDDTASILASKDPSRTPLHVVASPLALRATLSKRRLAGDALSASVLARWREAGLLPAGPLRDSAVLFLDLGRGFEVPFPRACVLTSSKKGEHRKEKNANSSARGREKVPKACESLFRSRKRPRSPSVVVEEREEQRLAATPGRIAKPVPSSERKQKQKAPEPKIEPVLEEIPVLTAASFNAALVEAGREGLVDAYPVFKHPFARNPAPPLPLEQLAATSKNEDKKDEKSSSGVDADAIGQGRPGTGLLNASEITPKVYNSRNDLDMFGLMDSRADSGGDQGMMPNIDMSDFGALDDDVTNYFGGGMDNGFLGLDNITPSPQVPNNQAGAAGASAAAGSDAKTAAPSGKQAGTGLSAAPNAKSGSSAGPTASTEKKDKDLGISGKGINKKKLNPSAAIVAKVLASFASTPSPKDPPSAEDRDKALAAFHEENVNKKMADSLIAGLKPSQRCSQSVVCRVDGHFMPSYTKFGSVDGVRSLLATSVKPKTNANKRLFSLRHMYVPARRLKAYSKLSRRKRTSVQRTRAMARHHSFLDTSSDEESDTDSDSDMPKVDKSSYQRKLESETMPNVSEDTADTDAEVKAVDATKVAQAVAVDCASACLVLIEEYQRSTAAAMSATTRNLVLSGSSNSGSTTSVATSTVPATALEADAKSPALTSSAAPGAIGMSPSNASLAPSPRITNPSQGSFPRIFASPTAMLTNQRIGQRKDRESGAFLAFLALLQMQSMSVEGLQLFDFDDDACLSSASQERVGVKSSKDSANAGTLTYKPIDTVPASSAVLRRVLHGFPRTIECSKALRSYTVAETSGHSSGNLQVDGPLNISDLYGETTTVETLPAPQVCVGYNKDWMETAGEMLPLWEKAGLEPYSERKHVEYAVLAPKAAEQNAKVFFRDVSAAYEECSFGRHTAMPFESSTGIANSRSSGKNQHLKSNEVSPEETAMVKQYDLAVAGLCTKLKSLSSDRRRNTATSNFVVYVVSPFARGRNAANSALLKSLTKLLNSFPGSVGPMGGQGGMPMNLPATAWRLPSSHGNALSLHVRVIPHEAIDRKLSTWMQGKSRVGVPLRPQLVKALAFSVFSSIRSKLLRVDNGGGKESTGSINGMVLSPDDQMSPMTPDFVADCPAALSIAPHSPLAIGTHSTAEDGVSPVHNSSAVSAQTGVTVDQSSALTPSFLHEPAVVLAGVGCQMGDPTGPSSMVLHLAYGFCKEASRYVFSWTDRRGEMLDSATVPVLKNGINKTRRSAFWYMWCRGQRWKLPYVEATHVTIAKLGDMVEGEVEDWDVVLSKILNIGSSTSLKSADVNDRIRVVRRFPCTQAQKHMDGLEGYIDHPTPATPAGAINVSGATSSTPVGHGKSEPSSKQQVDHGIRSVSLVCLRDSPRERLIIDVPDLNKKQDFLVIAGSSLQGERYVQGKALLGSVGGAGLSASEIDLVLHYGSSNRVLLEKSIARHWDGEMPSDIIRTVAENFHDLRFVGSPPCWPEDRWRSRFPLHIELVRNFRNSLKFTQTPHATRSSLK